MTEFRVNLKIDPARLILRLRPLTGFRGLAYAAVNSINAAALKVQEAAFENVRSKFTIRRPAFFFGTPGRPGGTAARLTPRANVRQGRPYAEVVVRGPLGRGGSIRRTLLPEFERGGTKGPSRPGASRVAIPVTGAAARPAFPSTIPPDFTFAGMGLRKFTRGRAITKPRRGRRTTLAGLFDTSGRLNIPGPDDVVQIKGRHRTFVIRPDSSLTFPQGGVFRRIGAGQVELVYAFRRRVHLEERLGFVPLALATARTWLPEMLEREVIREIRRVDRVGR